MNKDPAAQATTEVDEILAHCRTVAVVGLSPKEHRDSFRVAHYMQAQGWKIVPINPNAATILGETSYASLPEAAQFHRIDLVDVFRNSNDVPPIVDDAIAIGVKGIWLQMGVTHEAAATQARAAGLLVVQDKCLMVEHRRRA